MKTAFSSSGGFTLMEVLTAMAISGVVMAGIYSVYSSQQRSYRTQEEIADMQKNLRAAAFFLEKDIRMAGCDPTGGALAGIKEAKPDSIRFTMDVRGGDSDGIDNDGDGKIDQDDDDEAVYSDGDTNDTNEDVSYSLYTSGGIRKLGRETRREVDGVVTKSKQPVAEQVESLRFTYLDGASPPTVLDDDGNGAVTTHLSAIRSVRITLTVRTASSDPQSLHFKASTTQVKCRNLGF